MTIFLCFVALFANFNVIYGNPSHEIKSLPGLYIKPNFKQYSGYLIAAPNIQLHYWFVESQTNSSFDPVVIWLNGGPGCSSLFSLLAEHGPLHLSPDLQLKVNNYAWNRISNVLYIDAPVKTGFSYATDNKNNMDDDNVAEQIYNALLDFLKNYPKFRLNPLYVTGESYAGVYVSILCNLLANDTNINLKGLMVGNGFNDIEINAESKFYYQKYHGLINEKHWEKCVNVCCPNRTTLICHFMSVRTTACNTQIQKMEKAADGLNIHNLYKPCYKGVNLPSDYVYLPNRFFMPNINRNSTQNKARDSFNAPCINDEALKKYLNQALVRQSIQIPNFVPKWTRCNSYVFNNHKNQYKNLALAYKSLIDKQKYRIWFYNGDLDMTYNYLGQQWFLESLEYPVEKEYARWTYTGELNQQQLGGFYIKYSPNITYFIVSGAGHMVPADKPLQAFLLFQAFILDDQF